MRRLSAILCLCLFAGGARADERWSEDACRDVQKLEGFYEKNAPDLTSKAWAVRPLLVIERDHCGLDVHMKVEDTERVIKMNPWPAHVCAVLSTKRFRTMLARELDNHCSTNVEAKDAAVSR